MVECHDPDRAVPVVERNRPEKFKGPQPMLKIGKAILSKDGTIANGEAAKISKLRCARSPWLDRGEYRYLPGPKGRLAVVMLEEDDVRESCARLDAQCAAGWGPRYWRVLLSLPACP